MSNEYGLKLKGMVVAAPITADADPNTTAPRGDRIHIVPLRFSSLTTGNFTLGMLLLDGTSVDATVWVWQADLGAWFKVNATAQTVNAKAMAKVDNVPPDAEVFIQLTNVVGAPTKFGHFFM